MAMRLLQYVDELGPEHFLVLKYLANPIGWYESLGIERVHYMSAARRQALNDAQIPLPAEVIDIVLSDLQARGLADTGMLGGMVSENSVYGELATARGRELMAFVQIMATPDDDPSRGEPIP